jgi:hypothetical protein
MVAGVAMAAGVAVPAGQRNLILPFAGVTAVLAALATGVAMGTIRPTGDAMEIALAAGDVMGAAAVAVDAPAAMVRLFLTMPRPFM